MTLLQTISSNPAVEAAAQAAQAPGLSLWDLCVQGGFIMIVLAVLSLICIYVFIERAIVIRSASRENASLMQQIRQFVHSGDIDSARRLCREDNSPYARIIDKGLSRIGRKTSDVLVTVENAGNLEVSALAKGLPWLATTSAGAPMLGFLGTVIGMVQAFYQLAGAGTSANIGLLADGIYQALVTTVAGLVVGIFAMFAYNYLNARINRVMNRMEGRIMEFMDLLNEPA